MAGSRRTSLRLFLRFLLKALTVRKSRVLTAFLSIALGACVVAAMSLLYLDVSRKMSEELRAFGPNFFLGPRDSASNQMLREETLQEALAQVPEGQLTAYSPYLYGIVRLGATSAVIAGARMPSLRALYPYWQVDGQWVSVGFDERNCMIGASLAEKAELEVGDTVQVSHPDTGFEKQLTVKGIVRTGQAEDEQLFVNISLAREVQGGRQVLNHAMLSVRPEGLDVGGLASGLEERFPSLVARPIRKISYSEGKILDRIEGLMALTTVLILLTTTLCVMSTLTAIVAERTPEIGLMKALGAEDHTVALHFLSETFLICLGGVLLGVGGGFVLAQVLGRAVFGAAISFRPAVLPLTLGVSLVSALMAAVLPVRNAVRVVPARVLRGEA